MSDLIPSRAKQWAGLIVSILVVTLAGMAEWADMGTTFVQWTGRLAALLVVISNVLGLSVPSRKAGP